MQEGQPTGPIPVQGPGSDPGMVQDERVLRAALDTHRLYITSAAGGDNYNVVSCLRAEHLTSFWVKVLDSHRLHITRGDTIDH